MYLLSFSAKVFLIKLISPLQMAIKNTSGGGWCRLIDWRYAMACMPLAFTNESSFKAAPLGFFMPRSHSETWFLLIFR